MMSIAHSRQRGSRGSRRHPKNLTEPLRKADRFVLLGFELERWYFQLFLHYVNRLDGAFDNFNQNFPMLSPVGEDSREFVMKQFNIPQESQVMVFSKTSKQNDRISPQTPRVVYFGDNAYVGYCLGGSIEVATIDPKL